MRLGIHFTLSEFLDSLTAAKHGLVLEPSPESIGNMRALVGHVLDPLRTSLGVPVRITSGYRSGQLNVLLRGSRTSQHLRGEAADIKAQGFTAIEIARRIVELGLEYDQVIWYDESRGGHVHVSYSTRRPNRRQILHAPARGGYVAWSPSIH